LATSPRRTSRYFGQSVAEARSVFRSRPTEYDADVFDTIIDMIASGESLNEICEDRDAPLPATFYRWCKEDARLAERYRDALEMQADVLFEEATSAAYGNDAVQAGVRHRALLARAQLMMPEKYGPRATIKSTTSEDADAAGIDYAGEVRRRLGAMAERMQRTAASDSGPEQQS
jgi:hypothetical protein